MSSIISKSISQDKSNDDNQILKTNRINSSEDSASDESVSEYSYNKKRKKTKVKKSVGRPKDPVNHEYIKLGLYNSEDDFDDLEDNLEDNPITNEVDSNILKIENSVNLNLALNNTNQPLVLDEVIDHSENDFDIDVLVNQEMQMRNTSINKEN
ncbi:30742_t:CDS:2 [Gigaspora margarita]|uniref:30742_t:CDS:1 n=1 Tax=Gigaspora margarita TaxID=4874 RepID=A0ABN7W6A5_GIGMA|nr:30742_t:CDS:2 [Gigaspora margarita]